MTDITPRLLQDSTTFKNKVKELLNNRRNGIVTMSAPTYDVIFTANITGDYVISLSGNAATTCWFSDVTPTGFKIHAASGMTVHWSVESKL